MRALFFLLLPVAVLPAIHGGSQFVFKKEVDTRPPVFYLHKGRNQYDSANSSERKRGRQFSDLPWTGQADRSLLSTEARALFDRSRSRRLKRDLFDSDVEYDEEETEVCYRCPSVQLCQPSDP